MFWKRTCFEMSLRHALYTPKKGSRARTLSTTLFFRGHINQYHQRLKTNKIFHNIFWFFSANSVHIKAKITSNDGECVMCYLQWSSAFPWYSKKKRIPTSISSKAWSHTNSEPSVIFPSNRDEDEQTHNAPWYIVLTPTHLYLYRI